MLLRIMPFNMVKLGITTLSITIFSIMRVSIRNLLVTLKINNTQQNKVLSLC
jgi:hypothetical protein